MTEEYKLKQISVFIENKLSKLSEIADILGKSNVNIKALSFADTPEYGILRLLLDEPEKAYEFLKEHAYTTYITDVIAVEVPDKPGGIANILKILENEKINVEYMYPFVERSKDFTVMIFRFDDIDRAIKVLQDNNIVVLKSRILYSM